MSHFKNIAAVSFLLISSVGTPVLADGGIKLEMTVHEEIVTKDAEGKTIIKLIEPKSVVPGDVVVYTTNYKNEGNAPADNVAVRNPIPEHLIYRNGSAEIAGSVVSFSVDGGKSFDKPENLIIVDKDGKERPATNKDYTHIRWLIDTVAPQAEGSVSFRAKLK